MNNLFIRRPFKSVDNSTVWQQNNRRTLYNLFISYINRIIHTYKRPYYETKISHTALPALGRCPPSLYPVDVGLQPTPSLYPVNVGLRPTHNVFLAAWCRCKFKRRDAENRELQYRVSKCNINTFPPEPPLVWDRTIKGQPSQLVSTETCFCWFQLNSIKSKSTTDYKIKLLFVLFFLTTKQL